MPRTNFAKCFLAIINLKYSQSKKKLVMCEYTFDAYFIKKDDNEGIVFSHIIF